MDGVDKKMCEKNNVGRAGRARRTVWNTVSDSGVRSAVFYRKKSGLPIEPDLNEELERRFFGWDSKAQVFTRKRQVGKKNTGQAHENQHKYIRAVVPLYCENAPNKKFSLFLCEGSKRQRLLGGATVPYELCLFDVKTRYAVVRKTAENGKSKLYVIDCNAPKVFSEIKVGVELVYWVAGAHDLYATFDAAALTPGWHVMPFGRIVEAGWVPHTAKSIRAATVKSTVILDADGRAINGDLVRLMPGDMAQKQNEEIKTRLFKNARAERVDNVSEIAKVNNIVNVRNEILRNKQR